MFHKDSIKDFLLKVATNNKPKNYFVAYSGGMDSTVLLHSLVELDLGIPITAIHVNHQNNESSDEWEKYCSNYAAKIDVPFISHRVDIDMHSGYGIEAAMRNSRYKAFSNHINSNDWLLTAHHKNDQVETLFLNLFRGSGIDGLSGISAKRKFLNGTLARPLLDFSKNELRKYALFNKLTWIEDSSNKNNSMDRNYLRNDIIPRLEKRWPSINKRLTKVTKLASEAKHRSEDLAKIDLKSVGSIDCYNVLAFKELSDNRQRNLLRYSLAYLNLPQPSYKQLFEFTKNLVNKNNKSNAFFSWPGVYIYRYNSNLYLITQNDKITNIKDIKIFPNNKMISLGPGMGTISLAQSKAKGIDLELAKKGLDITFRKGGESFKPMGSIHTRRLKKLLQEKKIFPWMRDKIPLLMYENELVGVGNLWVAEKFSSYNGCILRWYDRPEVNER